MASPQLPAGFILQKRPAPPTQAAAPTRFVPPDVLRPTSPELPPGFIPKYGKWSDNRPDPSGALLQDFNRGIEAGGQGTSPIVRKFNGDLNYKPVGKAMIGDDGNYYVNGQQTNSASQVVLTDPATGVPMVYERSPEMAEGPVTSAARLILPGVASSAPSRLAGGTGAAERAVTSPLSRMSPDIPGAITGPMAGARLSPSQIVGAFTRSNVQPSAAAVFRNRGVSGIAHALNETIVGVPISKSVIAQSDQAAVRAQEIASGLSDVGRKSVAGERLQAGATHFKKVVAPQRQDALYDYAASLMTGSKPSPLTATRGVISDIERMIANPEIRGLVTDKNYVKLSEAVTSAADSGISFNDLRQLRTLVRELRPAEGSAVGINKITINRLYDGLTQDMLALARENGGDVAVHAIKQADRYTRALATSRLPAVEKLLDPSASGENAFLGVMRLAKQGAGEDWRKLVQIQRTVGKEAWDDFSATIIRQMGNPKPGAMTSVDLDQFSPATFMTEFNSLSTQGKNILFGSRASPLRQSLDDLSTVLGELKRVQSLGNTSGTGRVNQAFWTLVAAFTAPKFAVPAMAAGYSLSKAMTSPRLVRWLTNGMKIQRSGNRAAWGAHLMTLPAAAGQDQEIIGAVQRLISAAAATEVLPRGPQ